MRSLKRKRRRRKSKDITKILGYSKTENAVKRHVSEENKMRQICWHPVSGGQQNETALLGS